jgi:integration host factor subunit alpha
MPPSLFLNLIPLKRFFKEKMAITEDKLTLLLQVQLGMSRPEARQIVERLFRIMKDTLSRGENLLISGFGKFSVRQKRARQGRNPQTEEKITIAPRRVVGFKLSGILRRRLNTP